MYVTSIIVQLLNNESNPYCIDDKIIFLNALNER